MRMSSDHWTLKKNEHKLLNQTGRKVRGAKTASTQQTRGDQSLTKSLGGDCAKTNPVGERQTRGEVGEVGDRIGNLGGP